MTSPVEYHNPPQVPEPLGQYSHCSVTESLVHVAGQVGVRADGSVGSDFGEQFELALQNVQAVLRGADTSLDNVLQMVTYLVSDSDIEAFYSTRSRIFPEHFSRPTYPPNTLLVVSRLVRREFRIEIQATAAR